jgi:hypothetical protein
MLEDGEHDFLELGLHHEQLQDFHHKPDRHNIKFKWFSNINPWGATEYLVPLNKNPCTENKKKKPPMLQILIRKALFHSGFRIKIRIVFGSWIRIRIRKESWIRIRMKVKIQELSRLKIEPWRDADAKNRGLEEGLQASGRRFASPWWEAGSGSGTALRISI